MKKIKQLALAVLAFCSAFNANAQDKDNPWVIGVGLNAVDVPNATLTNDAGKLTKDYFGVKDWNSLPVITRGYISRYISNGFSVDAAGSFNSITKIPGDNSVTGKSYLALDLGVRYDLNEAFGETAWFDPYAKFGFGSTIMDLNGFKDGDHLFSINPAVGFNIWLHETIGLNFESMYKLSPFDKDRLGTAVYVGRHHLQHSVSLIWRFGKKDMDGDGVSDKRDVCPDVPGLEEFDGCPDTDGDGIKDSEDSCPNVAGTVETNGCPDSDGDGIKDSSDLCPNDAGEFNGCPDSDGDGVADNYDACPKIDGPKENKGCPWPDTDNDGVKDNEDKCVNEKGPASNNGCPEELSEEAVAKLGAYAKTIQFNTGKATFKPGVAQTLDAVAEVMKEFRAVKFDVEGHSDSVGNDNKNLALSQKRAQAVVDYLASHGIDGARLKAVGYGEAKPIASNKTRAGRAQNRRVVLTAVK